MSAGFNIADRLARCKEDTSKQAPQGAALGLQAGKCELACKTLARKPERAKHSLLSAHVCLRAKLPFTAPSASGAF